jgi:CDP-diacylglycerol--glycerol-3-phosphate 3-phosphatidyltransferase
MRPIIPSRLRNQSWLAAVMLLSPWLLAIALNLPLLRRQSIMVLTLLPGLAVAVHVQHQLSRHLEGNHRLGEEGQLYPTLGAANWISLLRAGAIVSLGGFLPMALLPGHDLPAGLSWAPGLVYLGIAVADLLDGLVAKRQKRETELGKRLDVTSDAAGLLVASLLAVTLGRLPAVYLLVGLAYYPFIFGLWLRQKRRQPLIAIPPRPYARIIAGFQMGLVGMALLPILHPTFTVVAAYIFMLPLLTGFLRDWLVVSCRLATDGNQQTAVERRIGVWWMRRMPLVLRLAILVCGAATLADGRVYPVHPLWHLALGLGCLFVGLGLAGRSAALFLTLLLGSNQSPFGMSTSAMILFGATATLMLTGTGDLSLWAPEERLLYRRNGKKATACSETQ